MKKSFTLLSLLGALIFVFFKIDIQKKFTKENCPFCNPKIVEAQAVYRKDGCLALLNYKPAVRGHMLILPTRHVERFEDLTKDEVVQLQEMIARVDRAERAVLGATGYILLEKNGPEAGQSVPHVHFHYFPRKNGDSHVGLAVRMFLMPWLKPLANEELLKQRLEFQRDGLSD